MTTVGFIGLGVMGAPMAANLVKAGYSIVGYNRHPEPIERLAAAGGWGASGVAEAVAGADVAITMHPRRRRPGQRRRAGAVDASLSIMVGGSPEDFAAARPVLGDGGQDCRPRWPARRRPDR